MHYEKIKLVVFGFRWKFNNIKKLHPLRKIIILLPLSLLGLSNLFAQQNVDASGGNAIGPGGSISYSIGQIDYITATGPLAIITAGLQQPYEILIISGIEKTDINLSIYPNPTTDFVELNIQNFNAQNMMYMLYDVQGKLIEKKKINGSQTIISMVNLANDIYFIKVLNNANEIKIFKIIKNK